MLLFRLLPTVIAEIEPRRAKVHLATTPPGGEDPLDVFRRGDFETWQAWQSKRNFGRPFVVSLIVLPERHHWLYAGCYRVHGVAEAAASEPGVRYKTEHLDGSGGLVGRVVVRYRRTGRNLCRLAERVAADLEVVEIRREALTVPAFGGFDRTSLRRSDLELIVSRQAEGWRVALSSVKGIYCIADDGTGKLYVGKADGARGFWQRWSDYAASGHGGNKLLVELLRDDPGALQRLRYTVLEVMDARSHPDEVNRREEYWKRALLSRAHGLNAG